MAITEERLVDGQVLSETTSAGLYHPGECHSQAFVMFILERAEREAGEPETN